VLHVVGVLQHWGRDVKPGQEVPLRVESDLVNFRKFTVRIRPFGCYLRYLLIRAKPPVLL
jgi:hypothetical protein